LDKKTFILENQKGLDKIKDVSSDVSKQLASIRAELQLKSSGHSVEIKNFGPKLSIYYSKYYWL